MKDYIFSPNNIAVIGSSANSRKLGYQIYRNLLDYNFKGQVFPVNPNRSEVMGHRVYKSINDIEYDIDLAVIVVPSYIVPSVMEECALKKVKAVLIISAGFKEIGDKGKELEEDIQKIAAKGKIDIIGPNCFGVISTKNKVNATFASPYSIPTEGNIYFISQSGALSTAMLDWASKNDLGISRLISIGNKAGINENDLLKMAEKDEVIGLYLESLTDGTEILKIGKKISKNNPIIVCKPGKYPHSQNAIKSHTGALIENEDAVSSLLSQAGFIEAEGIEEMFDLLKAFSWQPLPKGKNIAIVTNTGGVALITTDIISKSGLNIAKLSSYTQKILSDKLPREANIHNPIDIIGDALADRYAIAIDAVLSDTNTDALLVLLTPQTTTQIERIAKYIYKLSKVHKKTVIASFMGGALMDNGIKVLNKYHIPSYTFPERAVFALQKMYDYSLKKTKDISLSNPVEVKVKSIEKVKRIIIGYEEKNQKVLNPKDAEKIVKSFGIKIPKSYTPSNINEAVSMAKEIGYPVSMKISTEKLLHKSDIGAVKLNINSPKQVKENYRALEGIISHHKEWEIDEKLNDAIVIQKFINSGIHTIVGAVKYPHIGHLILFGMGGIYTEIFKDSATRIAPVSKEEVESMIEETKVYKILKGTRGEKEKDIDSLIDTILKLSKLVSYFPQIEQVDINPLAVMEKGRGSLAIDVKMILES